MLRNKKISVVVPAYNVQEFIAGVISGMPGFIDVIYVIDDCSHDETYQLTAHLADPRVHLYHHRQNQGPGAALNTGYRAALQDGADIIIKMDGDGQMDPIRVLSLVMPLLEGRADYSKGNRLDSRPEKHGMPLRRRIGNRILSRMTRLSCGCHHVSDSQNGFTAVTREALIRIGLNLYPHYGYLNDILARLSAHGLRVLDVPMPAKYGDETSGIKPAVYFVRMSVLLTKIFLRRVHRKYLYKPADGLSQNAGRGAFTGGG